ncbi:hypothetical protein Q7C_33 [Methylophaga frappieri]|uniref:Uncharacterized protein n=1 Tax=Methylophaga frappieri (strain ATCC BAA-2434 / DSM 25690 / JAM7) TaxID=754477 RepID=I1YE75_METFJ|nr:hypothetical protein Q7C_33 [Methylophaga frappieri]
MLINTLLSISPSNTMLILFNLIIFICHTPVFTQQKNQV